MAMESHVSTFVGERLQKIDGTSIAFSELWSAYEAWCAAQGRRPLSTPKFAAEMKLLGYGKYKSCGLMRYRDLQLAA
jgi:hypothetical protein